MVEIYKLLSLRYYVPHYAYNIYIAWMFYLSVLDTLILSDTIANYVYFNMWLHWAKEVSYKHPVFSLRICNSACVWPTALKFDSIYAYFSIIVIMTESLNFIA